MRAPSEKLREKAVDISLDGVKAAIICHMFKGAEMKTLLVSFDKKRRVLSTLDGYKESCYVANAYAPPALEDYVMKKLSEFKRNLPLALGIDPKKISLLITAVDMDNLAVCEQSYEEFTVCCLATGGAKENAMRMGQDVTRYVERGGHVSAIGTINLILLTNATLTEGAMARAIITATEAKTAALQDLDVKSTYSPQYQATGTGTDNMIVVSGKMGKPLHVTSGHTKMSELIAFSTKIAVTEALKKHDK
ncbi:MAG TPA: adenosylcobinamide amidohydrolase [Candidatus Limnocylindrales bacterium]|nr:adenosylcobinamide amidohydrolase [Candidatus Limnocylindrales bacterium]